jgi:hypothetical protein
VEGATLTDSVCVSVRDASSASNTASGASSGSELPGSLPEAPCAKGDASTPPTEMATCSAPTTWGPAPRAGAAARGAGGAGLSAAAALAPAPLASLPAALALLVRRRRPGALSIHVLASQKAAKTWAKTTTGTHSVVMAVWPHAPV